MTTDQPSPPVPPGVPPEQALVVPNGPSQEDKLWAAGAHLSGLVGVLFSGGVLGFIGPLVIWLIKKDESEFIADHAWKALRGFLVFFVVTAIMVVLMFCLWIFIIGIVFLPLVILATIAYMAYSIYATVRAAQGELISW